jgi:hypothetical protein
MKSSKYKKYQKQSSKSLQMIKYAMNIEDLSSQNEMKKFVLKIRQVFPVTRSQLPQSFAKISLCLVPMGEKVWADVKTFDGCFFVDRFMNNQIFEG